MEKGINLSLTKSLVDFGVLLDKVIETAASKKLSVEHELDDLANTWGCVGKYVKINDSNDEAAVFWIGFGAEEYSKEKPCIWLEFDAKTNLPKYWDKLNKLIGTTGKYYSEIDFEFAQVYMNAWIHFYLKDEHAKQFFGDNTDINVQKEILAGFVDEVMGNL